MGELEQKEKAAFFALIRADPGNNDTRLVFADWCEERGDMELAGMLRGGSEKWLREYAANLNPRVTYEKYRLEGESDNDWDDEVYVRTSYEELLAAAHAHLDSGGDRTHHLNFDTPDFVYQSGKEFWKHFEVMTGRAAPDDQEDSIFIACAC